MKKSNLIKAVIVVSVVLFAGFASYAMADRGYGNHMGGGFMNGGGHMMGGYGNQMGYGMDGDDHMMGDNGNQMGYGMNGGGHMWDDLSDEDRDQMIESMNSFFDANKDVRNDLYQKSQDLRDELVQEDVDHERALELQKEISALEGKFNESRLNHMMDMQKQYPDYFEGGYGMHHGMGYGMMGYGG